MKKNLCRILIAALSISLVSCDKDFDENGSNSTTMNLKSTSGVQVANGRLKFSDVESLRSIYADWIERSEEDMASEMDIYFRQGFVSLRPIVTEQNELEMVDIYDPLIQKVPVGAEDKYDVFDNIENLIGDDTFAAMLNWQGEIAVGDEIYKYTDVGLFITKDSTYNNLIRYLGDHHISPTPAEPTDPGAGEDLIDLLVVGPTPQNAPPCHGSFVIDASTTLVSIEPDCVDIPPQTPPYTPSAGASYADPNFGHFVDGLKDCGEPSSGLIGDIFADLFGDNYKCIDKYQSKRRVKTKAYNYNYILVYHAGAKVKHQFKGILWRKEAQPELRLVVEAAQFEYDFTSIFAINTKNIYYYDNKEITYNPDTHQYTQTPFDQNGLPLIIRSDLSINLPNTGISLLDNTLQDGVSNAVEAKQLNEFFYGQLFTGTQNILGSYLTQFVTPNNRSFSTMYPSFGKVIIQKSVYDTKLNSSKREKTFDIGGGICWEIDENGNGGPVICSQYYQPKNFKIKILAGSRDGSGNWHGSKFSIDIN